MHPLLNSLQVRVRRLSNSLRSHGQLCIVSLRQNKIPLMRMSATHNSNWWRDGTIEPFALDLASLISQASAFRAITCLHIATAKRRGREINLTGKHPSFKQRLNRRKIAIQTYLGSGPMSSQEVNKGVAQASHLWANWHLLVSSSRIHSMFSLHNEEARTGCGIWSFPSSNKIGKADDLQPI